MVNISNLRILRTIPLLLAVFIVNLPAQATVGVSTYIFLPDQSTVVQTGGIAGVHRTYVIEGQFQLSIDPNAGVALFTHVDANATDDSPYRRTLDPNEVFNMTELVGTVFSDMMIAFTGKAGDGSDVLIIAILNDDLMYLIGKTFPPAGSADFFIFSLDAVAQRKYGGGSGTAENPYQIATAANLIALGETPEDYHKHFIMTADIDLAGHVFDKAIIAPDVNDMNSRFDGNFFTGVFDGKGHTISCITIVGKDYLGLFGQLERGGVVKGLRIDDANIAGDYCVGGLAGINGATVFHCCSEGLVGGSRRVGGLVGYNYGAVARCYSTGAVSGADWDVGGLVGLNWPNGDVTTCYSAAGVSGKERVGGLVGCNVGQVTECYSIGFVSGDSSFGVLIGIGGLVGSSMYWEGPRGERGLVAFGTTTRSFWDVVTSDRATSAGGVGLTTAKMQNIHTYLDAGWDWVGEVENGVSEVWQMPEGSGYPVLGIFSGRTPPPLQGMGTFEDPFLIYDAQELAAVVHYSPRAHYRLAAPIDLSGIRWHTPVVTSFGGTFDGNGLAISHLTMNGGGHLGLFGRSEFGAEIKSLYVVDVNVTGTGSYVGGLVAHNRGTVTRCSSNGSVRGEGLHGGAVERYDRCIGGLVGHNSGTINQCYSRGSVTGSWGMGIGGLVGGNSRSIASSYSSSSVSGDRQVNGLGGLVGDNTWGSIASSYSTGSVTGGYDVGGLVGYTYSGSSSIVTASFWDIQTSGQATSAWGTGKTTAEMQTAGTFLEAGWDFVGETANGTEDIWWILEGKDYPRLWWEAADE